LAAISGRETLIYLIWYIDVSAPGMSLPLRSQFTPQDSDIVSNTYRALLQLPRPILDYRIIIAIVKGDVGAVNILKDSLRISRQLRVHHTLLALGPTTPEAIQPPVGSRILWVTFTDAVSQPNGTRITIVPPNDLTDLSLNLEKLSKTRSGRIPLLVGDFLDNVLSVSTAPSALYAFLCKLFTRIRTNNQTAFFLATEDMHDAKKTAILRRFADVIIEYNSQGEDGTNKLEARILDHSQNHYSVWASSENPDPAFETSTYLDQSFPGIGRHQNLLVQKAVNLRH
jgi:hypothetical protein